MKQFRSNIGKSIKVFSKDGSSAIVTIEFAQLQDKFHSDAYAKGCISSDMVANQVETVYKDAVEQISDRIFREDQIRAAIQKMISDIEEKTGTKLNIAKWKPTIPGLVSILGYKLFANERDAVYKKHFLEPSGIILGTALLEGKVAERKAQRESFRKAKKKGG